MSALNDVLQIGYYDSSLGYDNVDGFMDEVIKLKTKMNLISENTKKINQ